MIVELFLEPHMRVVVCLLCCGQRENRVVRNLHSLPDLVNPHAETALDFVRTVTSLDKSFVDDLSQHPDLVLNAADSLLDAPESVAETPNSFVDAPDSLVETANSFVNAPESLLDTADLPLNAIDPRTELASSRRELLVDCREPPIDFRELLANACVQRGESGGDCLERDGHRIFVGHSTSSLCTRRAAVEFW